MVTTNQKPIMGRPKIETYKVCPESIQPHTMKNTEIIEEDTRYKKHCT